MSRVLARPLDTRTIALSVAGVLAVGTGVLTFNYLASVGHANAPAAKKIVLIAAKPIPSHALITADMISRTTRPADTVDPDALLAPAAAIGTVAVNDIPAGSLLTSSKVVRTASQGLPQRVHQGMRAVSISLDRVKGVSNLLEAGDRVDVIAILPPRGSEGPQSATILRGVRVLSIGQNIDGTPGATPSPDSSYTTATLEVTPKQADLLAMADLSATLRLALRAPKEPIRSQPVEKLSFKGQTIQQPAPRPAAPSFPQMMPWAMQRMMQPAPVATPKPKPTSSVMVVEGDQVITSGPGK